MTDQELIATLDKIKAIMISVATGGATIPSMQWDFTEAHDEVDAECRKRGIPNPVPYRDLWLWHGRWTQGDMPHYQQRRNHVGELFEAAVRRIRDGYTPVEPTGWEKVDRGMAEAKMRLAAAQNEEQFQAVGLLCREVSISVALEVYDRATHPPLDGVEPSPTDAKRMLDAYVAVELAGGDNEYSRKYARAAFDLSNHLQHRRTATFRLAALCVDATASVVNLVAILAGVRDHGSR